MQTLSSFFLNVLGQDHERLLFHRTAVHSCSRSSYSIFTWLPRESPANYFIKGHKSWWTGSSFPQGSHITSNSKCLRTLIPIRHRSGDKLDFSWRDFRGAGLQGGTPGQIEFEQSLRWILALPPSVIWSWSSHSTFWACFQYSNTSNTASNTMQNWESKT